MRSACTSGGGLPAIGTMVEAHAMDRDGERYVCGCGPNILQSSSSSNSEMRPRAMARAVNAQRGAGRHRMTRHDYELIVTYLEVPENFAAITGNGRKTKVGWRNLTKTIAFGHMAVSLCAQGFTLCNGNTMGKIVMWYVEMYKKARIFYLSTGAGLTDADIAAGLSFEQKMERMCHFFYRMHALYGARANIEPPAVGDSGLPDACIFDTTSLFPDSQPVPNVAATGIHLELSDDEEEAADREEDPMDFLDEEVDAVDYQTGPDGGGHGFVPTAMEDAEGGPDILNQTARSALDVEDPQPEVEAPNVPQAPSRGGVSQHSGEDLRSSGRDRPPRPGRDRPPTGERKNSLISAYEDQVKEKLVLWKAAQEHKVTFRDAILDDRRQAREAKQRSRMADTLELEHRARADRRSILMAELVKGGKTMDDVAAAFRVLDNGEQMINAMSATVPPVLAITWYKVDRAMWPGTQNAPLLSVAMAGKIWNDEEVLNLIHAVREVWTAQMANPTSLRIWDLIWMKLVQAGIPCSNLEVKFKWDSVFSDQILVAGCLERLGPESYWRMTLYIGRGLGFLLIFRDYGSTK
ncbi:hypothetical protein R1sor_026824 [Riccia sorocarpa]|uniref:Uncharacterized protein n=1 Tax=Riccia sorocarpa TaxID=122646 RepID=A0ABD3GE75_9MARC